MGRESAEFNDVLVNPLILVHVEVFDVRFCVTDGVVGAKVGSEFFLELREVVKPEGNFILVFIEDIVLKPFECRSFEIGKGIIYPGQIRSEFLQTVAETELEL